MERSIVEIARTLAWENGFNPDQLVVKVSSRKDSKFLKAGMAPVEIAKIIPVYMVFYEEATTKIKEELWETQ